MHVGFWGLAAIVIVMVSWLLYRYLTPADWKEWSRAGSARDDVGMDMIGTPVATAPSRIAGVLRTANRTGLLPPSTPSPDQNRLEKRE